MLNVKDQQLSAFH